MPRRRLEPAAQLRSMKKSSADPANRLIGPAIIVLAALVASAPLLARGPACGTDFGFHFVTWLDAEHSMAQGVLYPHWSNSPNFGAGEPRFVFYPPLAWMFGAFLGMFLPWSWVPLVFIVAALALTGLANRALAREVMADGPATLAGCAAIFFGYALFEVYKRSDFAEMTGGFWIPLLLLYMLRRRNQTGSLWRRAFDGSAIPLALALAGAWLSNGPLGLMASYLLAGLALVSTLLERSLAPLVRAVTSAALGLGLTSLYLLPAVWERSWASIQFAVSIDAYRIENGWLFAQHADPMLGSHDVLLRWVSLVATGMLAVAAISGLVAWRRGVLAGKRRFWLPLALIPPAILFLLLPVSLPVWNHVPALRLLQFPWRWLVVLEAPMAVFFGSAAWFDRRRLRAPALAACAAAFLGISLLLARLWFLDCRLVESSFQRAVRDGTGVAGRPEYAPPGIQYAIVDRLIHPACLLNGSSGPEAGAAAPAPAWDGAAETCNSSFQGAMYVPEHKRFAGVADHAGFLILRLRYYPAWRVTVNGSPVAAVAEHERGFMAVPVPKGEIRVAVDWTATSDVVAGRWLSGLSLALLFGLGLMERWLRRSHLSSGQ
jgi:hypothetical protein